MRKIYIIAGVAASLLCTAPETEATPLAPKPVAELLGLRSASYASPLESLGQPVNTTFTGRMYANNTSASDGPVINASVIYPDNVQGMWSYSTTSYAPKQLAIGIMASGGGAAIGDYYYCNRYLEMMGFEEIRKFSYKLSDWSESDNYAGSINDVRLSNKFRRSLFVSDYIKKIRLSR